MKIIFLIPFKWGVKVTELSHAPSDLSFYIKITPNLLTPCSIHWCSRCSVFPLFYIQDILSQAMDHSVLGQVAAINCSAFDSDSVLPTHLETRFHKLKSFPSTKPNSAFAKTRSDFASSILSFLLLLLLSHYNPKSRTELTRNLTRAIS